MYGWNWVRNAAYPTLKPTQDVLGPGIGYRIVIASRREHSMGPEEPENATGRRCSIGERQAAAHANTSIM